MFGTIRKHQTWLWGIIIALTIVSFVIFFSPATKVNEAARGTDNFGKIDGEKVSRQDFLNAHREVQLEYFFRSGGQWLTSEDDAKRMGFDVQRETYARLLLIQEQDRLGIHVGSDVAAQFATEMVKPLAQKMNAGSPQNLIDDIIRHGGMDISDFDRFIRHELGIQELISTIGLSGKLIAPEEAREFYIRENQEVQTEALFFDASNYLSQVTVTPQALGQFFTNEMANYRIPERVQVAYVAFPASNYLAQAQKDLTNLDEIVEANVARIGTNAFEGATTPDAKKAKVREELIRRAAMSHALRAARQFAGPLFEMTPMKASALESAARTNGLTVHVTAPFDQETGPRDLDVSQNFTRAAFALTPDDPFAQPIAGQDAVYLMAYHKVIPSEMPPLDQVRSRVTEDYKFTHAVMLAQKSGSDFYKTLTNGLAHGKTFEALAADAKLKPTPLPPFSLRTQELPVRQIQGNMEVIKELAFGTQPGKASDFRPTRDGGVLLFVKARLPVNEAEMKAQMPNFLAYLRRSRQSEAFNTWFNQEANKKLRETPFFANQQPAMRGGEGS